MTTINPALHTWAIREAKEEKWDRWFLGLAQYVSTASKDPSTKVGAVVVAADDRRKVAWGYNGFPPGIKDNEDRKSVV